MAAAHFRFQYESFKNHFDGILCIFYNFQMSIVTASGNELSLKISMPYGDISTNIVHDKQTRLIYQPLLITTDKSG